MNLQYSQDRSDFYVTAGNSDQRSALTNVRALLLSIFLADEEEEEEEGKEEEEEGCISISILVAWWFCASSVRMWHTCAWSASVYSVGEDGTHSPTFP